MENGIIASPERTEVVVAGEIRIVDRERRLRVTVRDRGKGIALKDRLRIFQPDFTTREKQGGTGLGLPRALAIITAHDGEIAFESELGEGSIFRIDIPEHAAIEA
ncbi:MAG: hypothetical protein FJ088_04495 [Deltaproteobacteria bacterium]|nr:hypothetical protein [Deltaproteobacteria bacterium]